MELTVISLFCGAGGSSLGYKWAGFKELLAIDFDKNAVETFKLNFKCPIWEKDIKEVQGKEILEFCNIKKGELDILDGSPPCQGFSTAGKRQINDNRNDLFKEFKRLINELQPKVFVMENVSGMIKGKMKGRFIETIKSLKELNYNVKCKLMNAKYYNVPQSRERVIFIGVRKDLNIKPSYPEPNNKLIPSKVIENSSNRGIDGKCLMLKGKTSKLIKELKKNERLCDVYERKHGKGEKAYFAFSRLSANLPTRAIVKDSAGLIHYKENRTLTIGEYKRIATFSDEFNFTGTFSSALKNIGNSVPPKFMQAIAENIKNNILIPYYKNL